MDDSDLQFMLPECSQTTRTWVQEAMRPPDMDRVHWEQSPTSSAAYNELRNKATRSSLQILGAHKLPSLLEHFDVMTPAANTLRSSLSSSTGSLNSSSGSSSKPNKHKKPTRAPRFEHRPVFPAPETTRFSVLSKQVAEQVDRNQTAKQRAEAKKLAGVDKGKQRASEPVLEQKKKSSTASRVRTEELVDSTNVSTDEEDYWESNVGEASLMDIDVEKPLERSLGRELEKAPASLARPPVAKSSHTKPMPSHHAPAHSKHPPSRITPASDVRRSVSAPQDVTKACVPALEPPAVIVPPRPKAQLAHSSRDPSPSKVTPASAPRQPVAPPTTQSRKPPALGMRRTNTHAGVSSTFRPSQEIPTKQRGFKTPFARTPAQNISQEVPYASFPVPQRSPTPEAKRGRPPQAKPPQSRSPSPEVPVQADSDSSYGDISLDQDTINEIMSQYD